MKTNKNIKIIIPTIIAAGLSTVVACNSLFANNDLEKDEFAKVYVEEMSVPLSDKPSDFVDLDKNDANTKYVQALQLDFPGYFDGKQWNAEQNDIITLENMISTMVRQAKIHVDEPVKEEVAKYNKQFFEHINPRNQGYMLTALKQGMINADSPMLPNKKLNKSEVLSVLDYYKKHQPMESKAADVVNLDEKKELRYVKGDHILKKGEQQYFPDGPLESVLMTAIDVPANSVYHQKQAIFGTISNNSPIVNGVGIWGDATSNANNARVWGGFISSRTPVSTEKEKKDAQIIGLEVDTINQAADGNEPNASKVGVQIVGIGKYKNSAAVELVSDNVAKWYNGILVNQNAIAEDGAILGVAQSGKIRMGIDLSNTDFTDSAIRLKNNNYIRFDAHDDKSNAALMYSDQYGFLTNQAGASGFRVVNNANDKELLQVDPNGNLTVPGTVNGANLQELTKLIQEQSNQIQELQKQVNDLKEKAAK